MIEIFHVRGNNYDVGYKIGQRFSKEMAEFYAAYGPLHSTFIPFYKSVEGAKIYNDLLEHSQKYFPGYIMEIKGYSDGSNLPFHYFFLTLIRVEIVTLVYGDPSTFNECSDVFLYNINNKNIILGHNEDMNAAIKGRAYILNCEILGNDGEVLEKFLAYSYPGHLPGNCMGLNLNQKPIVITNDGLSALDISLKDSTPRGILCRAVLGQGNTYEVIKTILTDEGRGSTVGFSVNVCLPLYKKENDYLNSLDSIRMYNIEVSPSLNNTQKHSHLSIIEISSQEQYYFHFNKYEHTPGIKEIPTHIINSVHRQKTAIAYEAAHGMKCKQDLVNVLGDTSDSEYPIYRDGFKDDTLATGVFDLITRKWEVYEHNPKDSQPIYTLDF